MRALLTIGLLIMSAGVFAGSFEFAGLSLATTPQDIANEYPNSRVSGSYVEVSPKDSHDHIFGIELFGEKLSYRLRISFESPERTYPSCEAIEKTIVASHGKPTGIRSFNEEAVRNRYLTWKSDGESVTLQCFTRDRNAGYLAEAIAVVPRRPK
jgi:hypothetical protein